MVAVQRLEETRVIEDTLKTLGEPVRLKDIIELTKETVKWRENSTEMMKSFMKHGKIRKAKERGMYEYGIQEESTRKSKKKEKAGTKNNKKTGRVKTVKKANAKDEVLKKIPDVEITENLVGVSLESEEVLENFRKDVQGFMKPYVVPKPTLNIGDIIEGHISGIEEYGAFVENESGTLSGLIHISNIRNGVTDDVNRHFKIGDKVKAKVIAVKTDGKIGLSTRDFKLPDYFEKFESKNFSPPSKISTYDDEFKQVITFIQTITGVVSEEARDKLQHMVEEKGMFKFMMALTEASRGFKVDVGMMFAKEIEEKMRNGL